MAHLTNRVFPGWWGDAKDGEWYISEWEETTPEGATLIYHFPLIKGQEPEDDGDLPWHDDTYIEEV